MQTFLIHAWSLPYVKGAVIGGLSGAVSAMKSDYEKFKKWELDQPETDPKAEFSLKIAAFHGFKGFVAGIVTGTGLGELLL